MSDQITLRLQKLLENDDPIEAQNEVLGILEKVGIEETKVLLLGLKEQMIISQDQFDEMYLVLDENS